MPAVRFLFIAATSALAVDIGCSVFSNASIELRAQFNVREISLKLLDRFEIGFITFLIGAATLIIVASVIHRYLSGLADSRAGFSCWASISVGRRRLCIIMFVWMAKFGAAYGVRTSIHVGVDVLINRCLTTAESLRDRSACWQGAVHRHHRHPQRHLRVGERRPLPDLQLARSGSRRPLKADRRISNGPTWMVYSAIPRLFADVPALRAGCLQPSAPANSRTTITAMSTASRRRTCRWTPIPTKWTTTCTARPQAR